MVVIRLQPRGKKKQRTFRVVVDNKGDKLTGKVIEDLGWFNPHQDEYELNDERVKYWLENGAQPSDTAHNLLVTAGFIDDAKRAVHSTKKKTEGDGGESPPASADKEVEEPPEAKVSEEESEKEAPEEAEDATEDATEEAEKSPEPEESPDVGDQTSEPTSEATEEDEAESVERDEDEEEEVSEKESEVESQGESDNKEDEEGVEEESENEGSAESAEMENVQEDKNEQDS